MRTPLVAANWKMQKTIQEALVYAADLCQRVADVHDVDMVVAPSFTALHALAGALADSRVGVAGQDVHSDPHGAFTGEVSTGMLKEAGARYVLIGHSERRQLFGETDDAVNAKMHAAIRVDLIPIMCVGETLAERESDQTFAILERQLGNGLADIAPAEAESVVVAYEPVWAIGTGRNATPEQAQEIHARIRDQLSSQLGGSVATNCRIIYGGSVKPTNVGSLSAQPDVDGALVGGASLEPESFAEIVAKSAPSAV